MARSVAYALLLAATVGAVADNLLLDCELKPGVMSIARELHVTITPAGAAMVRWRQAEGPAHEYRTTLVAAELGALREAVDATDFFDRPNKGAAYSACAGGVRLAVHLDGRRRQMICASEPDLAPVMAFPMRLYHQATAIQALRDDGDVYMATGAVKPSLATPKALQPAALKEPLLTYLCTHDDQQRTEWVLAGLAEVTSPAEFQAIVAVQLGKPARRQMILETIGGRPFHADIPEDHRDALCPIYMSVARELFPRREALDRNEQWALSTFARLLGECSYEPALPMFTTWFEAYHEPGVEGYVYSLARMGRPSIEALLPYLDSAEDAYRANAAQLLEIASRRGAGPRARPDDAARFAALVPVFRDAVIPRLQKLAADDPSLSIRQRAAEAAALMEHRLANRTAAAR